MSYTPKTQPFEHQATEFREHGLDRVRGIFWEQGTGKTKAAIDSAAALYEAGEIDGLLVIAPNGVHRNWVSDELPTHLPDRIMAKTVCHVWHSSLSHRRDFQAQFEGLLSYRGLAVLVMSYDAILTEATSPSKPRKGKDAAKDFLTSRRCLYVLDESPRIKNPSAKRTKRILASAKYAKFRRILTGTPVANTPMDLYSQLQFLDPEVWRPFGISSFSLYKTMFGVWEPRQDGNGRRFDVCTAFRNLDTLNKILLSVGSRVLKDDVLDLPPKLYTKRYCELTPEQIKLYTSLRDEYIAQLDSGEVVSAPLAIVRLVRLQQIVMGYVPPDDLTDTSDPESRILRDIGDYNPRTALLGEICEEIDHKVIIWCRFRCDVDRVMSLLGTHDPSREGVHGAVRYDGTTPVKDRGGVLEAFQRGTAKFLVANPATLSEGVTLHAARTVIYYSNSFNLNQRLQSEDRAHRIGQKHPVEYIDIVAADTVDEKIVNALRSKFDIASQVVGDSLRNWL